ncbi:hypothetical protein Pmani_024063 [Petrolisthes manimaculis]|uniref:C-type lectin domain-containing protein n=1 Tax=Petrolisthes manimaculis TaxID=1843537 RepID=A0AAE1U2R7_9EUCA|nr:hypothetical protein Pmani_024063 [Petrolisthes manimaculis]
MYTGSGRWSDITCDVPRSFICKKQGSNYKRSVTPTLSPEVGCSEGWRAWNHNCYYFSQDAAPWTSAQAWCRSHLDSELISVASLEENNFILGEVHLAGQDLWLGLVGDEQTKRWSWVDGSHLTFTNWQSGHHYIEDGLCAQYKADGTWHEGQWTPAPCEQEKIYICKTTAGACRDGWVKYEDKCYYSSDDQETWSEAREVCRAISDKSSLATLHSQGLSLFLAAALGTDVGGNLWIGLSFDILDKRWQWCNGEDVDYTWWAAGEPSSTVAEWSACGQLLSYPVADVAGRWAALSCDTLRPYICQLPANEHSVGCEAGWVSVGNYCYWYSEDSTSTSSTTSVPSSSPSLTMVQASTVCEARGAQLASVTSELENQLVVSLLHMYGSSEAYLGLTDLDHTGQLAWLDGSPLVFTAWDALQPNVLSLNPACVVVRRGSGRWGIIPCSAPRPYLCKKPLHSVPVQSNTSSGCDEGDLFHEGSCYHLPSLQSTWSDAAAFCSTNNAHLAALNNRPENGFLAALVGRLGVGGSWVGLDWSGNADDSVSFTWTNSDPVLFTNWGSGQPDVMQGGCVAMASEGLAVIEGRHNGNSGKRRLGEWFLNDCERKLFFVCEYPKRHYSMTIPPQRVTTEPVWLCPSDWFLYDQHCYRAFSDIVDWNGGESACRGYGGHLTSVSSPQEEEKILEFLGLTLHNHTYHMVWLGLEEGEGTGHSWSDGSAVGYVKWWAGEPWDQDGRYRCGAALRTTLHLLDAPCFSHLPYICKAHQGKVKSPPPPPSETPDEWCDGSSWLRYNDHCYLVLSSGRQHTPTTWQASRDRCRSKGGDLVSIHSNQENEWLVSKIFGLSDEVLWVGGVGARGSGFHWVDGTTFDFNLWAAGEPDNFLKYITKPPSHVTPCDSPPKGQEDCVGMYGHRGGRWLDLNCDTLAGSVCKRPQDNTTTQTTSPPVTPSGMGHCPQGWLPIGTTCLMVSDERKTFDEARHACSALSSVLSVHTPFQQGYLTAALNLVGEDVWLGVTSWGSQGGNFLWVDGSSLTYTNWAPGEPDGATTGEACVKATHNTGLWSDVFCEAQLSYVCQMDQDPYAPTEPSLLTCPPPYDAYISYGGACYRVVHTPKTWQHGEDGCVDEGGHLASADSPGEAALLWMLAHSANLTDHIWIGLNNRQLSSQFEWSDGRATSYSQWGTGEPDASLVDHSCVTLHPRDGLWYTQQCDDLRPAICLVTNDTSRGVGAPPLTGYCDAPDWVDLDNGYCYMMSSEAVSWGRASAACVKEGGHLASIHSLGEMVLVTDLIKAHIHPLWLGLANMQDAGYGWSDGTALDFLNWGVNEPDKTHAEGREELQCVEVSIVETGAWSNTHCLDLRRYICKKLKTQVLQVTNAGAADGPYTPIPPPTPSPTEGPKLTPTGILGIFVACVFVLACVVFAVNSYCKNHTPNSTNPIETANHNFEDLHSTTESEADYLPHSNGEVNFVAMTPTSTRRTSSLTSRDSSETV